MNLYKLPRNNTMTITAELKAKVNDTIIATVSKKAPAGSALYVDRYGHVQYNVNGKKYRYVIKDRVIRFEKEIVFSEGIGGKSKEWYRIKSYNLKSFIERLVE